MAARCGQLATVDSMYAHVLTVLASSEAMPSGPQQWRQWFGVMLSNHSLQV